METSIKRISTKKELEQAVEDAHAEGWKLKSHSDNVSVLEKSGGFGGLAGHALVFVLTVWFTFGFGNVAFALYRHFSGKKELKLKLK